jgi:hypothetical protein
VNATSRMTERRQEYDPENCWPMSAWHAPNIKIELCAICLAVGYNVKSSWQFCYAKQKKVPADKALMGTYGHGRPLTKDTKLAPCFLVGNRDAISARIFTETWETGLTSGFSLLLTAFVVSDETSPWRPAPALLHPCRSRAFMTVHGMIGCSYRENHKTRLC